MKKDASRETEFGVPIPGKILDKGLWAQTALKKLPPEGPLDLVALFGRAMPLVVDLGCGNGRYLLGSSINRPEVGHIGIDILPMVLRYATRRGNQRGLGNLRFAAIDAQRFLGKYLAPGSVREIHCYHPQPYHDSREMHKRLLTPEFLAQVHRVLEPSGLFVVQTDNAPYWAYLQTVLPAFIELHEQAGPWPDAPKGRTRREILGLKRRYPIYRGWGVKKQLSETELITMGQSMPSPTFDAGPRHRDLDAMERE